MKELWKKGTLRPTTKCWAQGMDGWRPLHSISQLKWCLMASGNHIMNESELAITCLDMLIDICKWYPNRLVDASVSPCFLLFLLLSQFLYLLHSLCLCLLFCFSLPHSSSPKPPLSLLSSLCLFPCLFFHCFFHTLPHCSSPSLFLSLSLFQYSHLLVTRPRECVNTQKYLHTR